MRMTECIGVPAMLEQLAEECAECGKAALKLSRILRKENPTPVSEGGWRRQCLLKSTRTLYSVQRI